MNVYFTTNQRSWHRFKANRLGYYSLWVLVFLMGLSLCAELLSNYKPLLIYYQGHYYFPLVKEYPATTFGGDFETEPDYIDPSLKEKLNTGGNWAFYPPNPYSYNTINYANAQPNPAPPSEFNLLGTDDHGRDVLAQLIYGFRLSLFFGFAFTLMVTSIGIIIGALQGYLGGRFDLLCQRFIEVWNSLPGLYLLIIFASIFEPSVLLLLILFAVMSWTGIADYVRAEFLRARNMDYVKAAHAMGVSTITIMWRHLLPNTLTPVITLLPFLMSGAITLLTSLDYLGLGMPDSNPSLGRLLKQGSVDITAWWLSITTVVVLVGMLTLLTFIGDALREAMDTRRG